MLNEENNFHWAIEILVRDRKLKPGKNNELLPKLDSVGCHFDSRGEPVLTYNIKDRARVMTKHLMWELSLLLEDDVVCVDGGRVKKR